MVILAAYFPILIFFVFLSALILLWKMQAIIGIGNWHSRKESEKLTSFGWLSPLIVVGMSFLPPRSVNGQMESIYKKIYEKYLSSTSIHSKEPHLVKLFGIPLGLVVYDYESFREIIQCDSCMDRGSADMLNLYTGGKPRGMAMNNGEPWKETKKYTMKKLGQLGFGKRDKMTIILSDQLPDVLDHIFHLKVQTGNKIQVQGLFSLAIVNIIWTIIGGDKFSENDPAFKSLNNATIKLTSIHFIKLWALSMVKNIKIVRNIFGYNLIRESFDLFHDIFKTFIDERKSLELYKENPENFVDHFLLDIEKYKSDDRLKDIYCTEQLIAILQDLFIGGMDTTSKYLESALMFMAAYPQVQLKVQNEIDAVVGSSCLPLYSDFKKSMPYTIATMMEIHRMAHIVALSPRYTTEECTFGRHHLQKGTYIGLIFYALRMDETYFKDAEMFRPERFLDANQNIIQERINRLLIFGCGPRACPGENTSMSTSFTMFTGILRKYSVTKGVKSEALGMKETCGFINAPHPFHISVFER